MTADDQPRGRDAEVVAALIAGGSIRATAREVGVSESTVTRTARRWRDHIQQAREEQAAQMSAALLSASGKAISRLLRLMDSPNDSVALGAARTVLDQAGRWRTQVVTEAEVAALVQYVEEHKRQQRPWGAA